VVSLRVKQIVTKIYVMIYVYIVMRRIQINVINLGIIHVHARKRCINIDGMNFIGVKNFLTVFINLALGPDIL